MNDQNSKQKDSEFDKLYDEVVALMKTYGGKVKLRVPISHKRLSMHTLLLLTDNTLAFEGEQYEVEYYDLKVVFDSSLLRKMKYSIINTKN